MALPSVSVVLFGVGNGTTITDNACRSLAA
jgi:hypothetical protein